MKNSHLELYARTLVNYCVEISRGDLVLLQGSSLAEPLVKAVYKAILDADAHCHYAAEFVGQEEIFYNNASRDQLEYVSPAKKFMLENADAMIKIQANHNTRELSEVDAERIKLHQAAQQELMKIYMERSASGEFNWNVCQYPTQADAQEAGLSLSSYRDFVVSACHLDKEDPVSYWQNFSAEMERIAEIMEDKDKLRFVSEDTDLTLEITDRTWMVDDARRNYPGGEIFSAPVEDSAEGKIRFSFPGIYQGREIKDIRLEFSGGKVTSAEAAEGEELLHQLLEADEGARYLGEVAVGMNSGIDRFTRNMLFDEKIGGTIHLALGRAYPESGGKNESSIHWDMLCDMRDGGEIIADGEVIYREGEFLV